jgi:hypothetical protein
MNHPRILIIFLMAFLSLNSEPVFACKPRWHQVSEYVKGTVPNPAVFWGTVQSVSETKKEDGTSTLKIVFIVNEWFSGKPQATVTVRGATGTYKGTDCEGQFDFTANAGEKWLIFGQVYEGAVSPDTHLSRKLAGDRAPSSLLEQLK